MFVPNLYWLRLRYYAVLCNAPPRIFHTSTLTVVVHTSVPTLIIVHIKHYFAVVTSYL